MKNPIVNMKIRDGKEIKIELYPSEAPESVKNFITLIKKGFFDGLLFWRVENDKLIQGGCPDNDGTGTLGYSIKSECKENGVDNNLKFTRGTIGLGRFEFNTENSEFFIVTVDTPQLDGKFTSFGRVVEGMDEVDRISKIKTIEMGFFHKAAEEVAIEKMTVDTFGVEYGEPEKLPGFTKEEMVKKNNDIIEERKKSGHKVI